MLLFVTIKPLLTKGILNIPKKSLERLLRQCLLYAFIIGIIVIISGFVLAFKKSYENNNKEVINIQTTTGDQSPAIMNKGQDSQVNLQYGVAPKENNQTKPDVPHDTHTAVSSNKVSDTEQHTEGNQSPAIISNGDVNITL